MMRFLTNLDPGFSATRSFLGALVQSSVIIVLSALLAGAAFRRRADARHALWLGVLIWVLLSPIAAAVAERSGLALWLKPLPILESSATAVVDETIAEAAETDALPRSPAVTRDRFAARAETNADSGTESAVGDSDSKAMRAVAPAVTEPGNRIADGLALLWLAGLFVGLARIAVGWRHLRAFSRDTRPLEIGRASMPAEAGALTVLGVETLPPILTSAAARGPVAVGLLQPRIVLPEGLAESISDRSLCEVLVHECAHVLRRDAWVGLLQRLAGALFWPHPLVHYVNGQLARAREEVCDNYVIRFGDPCGYARTLLALTTVCRPEGALRPGLGLLATRWTLADRVAGLIDTERTSMTKTSFRLKAVLAIALIVTGLSALSIRIGSSAQAGQPNGSQAEPKVGVQPTPNADFWNIEGIVVDEQGQPVAAATVRTMPLPEGPTNVEQKTAGDGTFRFTLKTGGPVGQVGSSWPKRTAGSFMGVDPSFDSRPAQRQTESIRIVVKPSRTVTVRVKDTTGAAVPGAIVEAAESAFRTYATAGLDGAVALRIPADARVDLVIAFKPKTGFAHFENDDKRSQTEVGSLPDELALTLQPGVSARIKAVDPDGQPVAGVVIDPVFRYLTRNNGGVQIGLCAAASATTDRQGVASFDWLPKKPSATHFNINPAGGYSTGDYLVYNAAAPADLTVRVRRATRLSGTVRFADGRPAGQIQVRASGWGRDGPARGIRTTRTGNDGQYAVDVPPERAYMVAVIDDAWAAQSLMNVAVREGQAQRGLDLTLIKRNVTSWTRFTEGPGHRRLRQRDGDARREGRGPAERLSRPGRQQGSAHARDGAIRR